MIASSTKTSKTTQEVTPLSSEFNGGFMHVIHNLYFSIQKKLEQSLVQHNQISFSQFLILVGFSCKDTPSVTQAQLSEILMITEATVSRHIGTLVGLGLLKKEKDSINKKSYNISLTPLGKKKFSSAKNVITTELEKAFSHISEKDKQSIMKHFNSTIHMLQQKK